MQNSRVGSAVSSFLGFGSRPRPGVPGAPPAQQLTRQPAAALPRTDATAAASPPAAHATVKQAAPAVGDPLVRTVPEKYGRAIAPEVVGQAGHPSTLGSSVEVPVKAHTRTVPAVPAVEKPLFSEPVTLDTLVAEFKKAQRITTQRVLLLGALCERWIRQQLAERTALDRATAIKKIRETLAQARLEKKEARVDLYVRCHWVAVLLGGWKEDSQDSRAACNELSFSGLRLFPILIERDSKRDTWQLTPKYAEAAKALWTPRFASICPRRSSMRNSRKSFPLARCPLRSIGR